MFQKTSRFPAANSEKGFQRTAGDDLDPDEHVCCRRATAEWAFKTAGDEHFDVANDLLNTTPTDTESKEIA